MAPFEHRRLTTNDFRFSTNGMNAENLALAHALQM
jgi:hypothetical protein